ncbi:hypothetical protein ACFPOD_11525 [Nitratireductor kimnyeongensis]|uniref:Late embryogenesis abundant protein LEA-2 subgroup domain-containing protein n=1 Tax=Nitratireductor kimnyeongensis TaxID=430679 RepID=A0ABW0TA00_9HYPH|nr:hypothetical protein [Nitratireductor kimnyeongensis]QZZ35830.1 hypothetical protein KW403_01260 [Nitratireductor kimnyeongensis]
MYRLISVALIAACFGSTPALSQSMSPMRGEIRSYTDSFAVRVQPRNPYKHRINVGIRAYDADFRPIEARISPADFSLGAGASRSVLVVVNFNGARERRVRICTESVPLSGKGVGMKAQICGKFIGHRL